MTASKIYRYIHGNGYPGYKKVPEKVAYLKERAGTLGSEVGTLVFQPHVTLTVVGLYIVEYLQPLRIASK